MLDVTIHADRVQIGRNFSVSFQRTLRIPDDGATIRCRPASARFPVRRVADYADRVPATWREHGGVLHADVPARGDVAELQRRAVAADRAQGRDRQGQRDLRRAVDRRLQGGRAGLRRRARASRGWTASTPATASIRQFVAMPLGMGYTVEGQVTGEERHRRPAAASRSTRSPGASPSSCRRAPDRGRRATCSPAGDAAARPPRQRRDGPGRRRPDAPGDLPGPVRRGHLGRGPLRPRLRAHRQQRCGARSPARSRRRPRSTPAPTPRTACPGSSSTTSTWVTSRRERRPGQRQERRRARTPSTASRPAGRHTDRVAERQAAREAPGARREVVTTSPLSRTVRSWSP